jgi:prepilin-type N-terminal cleavage/methylation domain-containing protein
MRRAFTLIEVFVSITILSIMMMFLYKSYASLNSSNNFYKKELIIIKDAFIKKKVIYLDFSLALQEKTKILNQETKEDVVFLQSSNSIHRRYNPYIAYIVKDYKLYRLESIKEFKEYPLNFDSEFIAECLGEVNSFRVYKSKNKIESYLVHIDFKKGEDILLKINVLQ